MSGSNATDDGGNRRGLGNLILGYDEVLDNLDARDRGGSHNLVVGSYHRFTQAVYGGVVAGEYNAISNAAASVTGGVFNTASGNYASVTGGTGNTASGNYASVIGGYNNTASNADSIQPHTFP